MSADEFDVIKRHFAPLARDAAARGLMDDVAVLQGEGSLVITTDTIVEGVHFLPDDPIETIAKKALRVNLSDLAAKGASPVGMLLALAWPTARLASDIEGFAAGLGQDLSHFAALLLGGDTTSTPGPLTITMTAIGSPLGARTPSRGDAKPGEDLWVTGEIGDAYLGLLARQGRLPGLSEEALAKLARRYQVPEPPVAFARIVAEHARASMDVSDGLLADAGKMAEASHCALEISAVPLSDIARAWQVDSADRLAELISGGDDYQILFTAPPESRGAIESGASATGTRVTRIGSASDGAGLSLCDSAGQRLDPPPGGGHRHKLGR